MGGQSDAGNGLSPSRCSNDVLREWGMQHPHRLTPTPTHSPPGTAAPVIGQFSTVVDVHHPVWAQTWPGGVPAFTKPIGVNGRITTELVLESRSERYAV